MTSFMIVSPSFLCSKSFFFGSIGGAAVNCTQRGRILVWKCDDIVCNFSIGVFSPGGDGETGLEFEDGPPTGGGGERLASLLFFLLFFDFLTRFFLVFGSVVAESLASSSDPLSAGSSPTIQRTSD